MSAILTFDSLKIAQKNAGAIFNESRVGIIARGEPGDEAKLGEECDMKCTDPLIDLHCSGLSFANSRPTIKVNHPDVTITIFCL